MLYLIVNDLDPVGPYAYTVDQYEYNEADQEAHTAAHVADPADNRLIFEIVDIEQAQPTFTALCYTYDELDEDKISEFVHLISETMERINATS